MIKQGVSYCKEMEGLSVATLPLFGVFHEGPDLGIKLLPENLSSAAVKVGNSFLVLKK